MKINICFAGGGIKAAAHIGALKALLEENMEIGKASGASSGSIIAAMHQIGYNPDEMLSLFKEYAKSINYYDCNNIFKLIKGIFTKGKLNINGLNSGKKLEKLAFKICKEKGIWKISDVKKPLYIPSVDLKDGKIIMFSSEDTRNLIIDAQVFDNEIKLSEAIRASCSFPGIFSPYSYKSYQLVDGGLRDNTPWKVLKKSNQDFVLTICFTEDLILEEKYDNILEIIDRSLDILKYDLSTFKLQGTDYLLKIKLEETRLLDSSKINYLYQEGYNQTKQYIKEIKNSINKK